MVINYRGFLRRFGTSVITLAEKYDAPGVASGVMWIRDTGVSIIFPQTFNLNRLTPSNMYAPHQHIPVPLTGSAYFSAYRLRISDFAVGK